MFSESFDTEQKDEMKELEIITGQETISETTDKKDEDENNMIEKTNAQINDWIRFLTNDDPNNLNNQEIGYTVQTALSESFEAGIGQIDAEKKIGFEKKLSDGRRIKVSGGENRFSLNISKENENGGTEELNIILSNFKNQRNGKADSGDIKKDMSVLPEMTINGNIQLLDKSLTNTDDIVKIVQSIEENIMRPERENVHGIKNKQEIENKEIHEKKQNDYKLLLFELDTEMNSNPPKTNETIAKYIINPENFETQGQYLSSRKTFLALCILLRSYNNIQEIKDKIIEDNKINIQKAANTKDKEAGENIVEYLRNNPTDLGFIIDYESDIVSLALKSINITQEEMDFLLANY